MKVRLEKRTEAEFLKLAPRRGYRGSAKSGAWKARGRGARSVRFLFIHHGNMAISEKLFEIGRENDDFMEKNITEGGETESIERDAKRWDRTTLHYTQYDTMSVTTFTAGGCSHKTWAKGDVEYSSVTLIYKIALHHTTLYCTRPSWVEPLLWGERM